MYARLPPSAFTRAEIYPAAADVTGPENVNTYSFDPDDVPAAVVAAVSVFGVMAPFSSTV